MCSRSASGASWTRLDGEAADPWVGLLQRAVQRRIEKGVPEQLMVVAVELAPAARRLRGGACARRRAAGAVARPVEPLALHGAVGDRLATRTAHELRVGSAHRTRRALATTGSRALRSGRRLLLIPLLRIDRPAVDQSVSARGQSRAVSGTGVSQRRKAERARLTTR